jgi:hypothetical protein
MHALRSAFSSASIAHLGSRVMAAHAAGAAAWFHAWFGVPAAWTIAVIVFVLLLVVANKSSEAQLAATQARSTHSPILSCLCARPRWRATAAVRLE